MNFEYFLAKRIIASKSYKSSISAPIIKIGIAAIAIGIVVMLIAVATGKGLQQKIREKVVAFNGHATITNYDNNVSQESLVPLSTDQEFYPEFNLVDGVKSIQAVAHKFGIIRTEDNFEGLVLKGVGLDYNWEYMQSFLVDGRLPNLEDNYSPEVLVSKIVADRLDFNVGDDFQMLFAKEDVNKLPFIRKFSIVGIYNSGFQELDKTFILGNIQHVQRMNKWSDTMVGHFEIFVDDYENLDDIGRKIYQYTPSTMNTETVKQKYISIFEWIRIFDTNIYAIINIMIIVAGINMITALLVLILERTQMIGVLKSLGSSNWSIRKVFLINASYLILRGLFWGNLIGLGFLILQSNFGLFPLNPDVYYVSEAPVFLDWTFILLLNIGTLVACLLMLLIPTILVSRIEPVKAMRFE